jgi:GDP-L-fucose synthase
MNKSFWQGKKILVTGGKGFVGYHVVNNLIKKRGVDGKQIIITNAQKNDLRDFVNAKKVVKGTDIILHLAADVGGLLYSTTHSATQLRNCLLMDLNIFQAAAQEKVEKLVAISSSVAYPANSPSPLKESDFFLGPPAASAYGFGFAKKVSAVLAQVYHQEKKLKTVVLIPNNAYGPGQDFNLESGHVIPSLIYKCLTKKSLNVWGDGKAIRDFLYVEDFAEGVLLAAEKLNEPELINLGSGTGTSVKELVKLIVKLTKFNGIITFDKKKPRGQAKRTVDIKRAKKLLGFRPRWTLEKGLKQTITWIKKEIK